MWKRNHIQWGALKPVLRELPTTQPPQTPTSCMKCVVRAALQRYQIALMQDKRCFHKGPRVSWQPRPSFLQVYRAIVKHTSEQVAVKLIDLELLGAHMVRQCQTVYSTVYCLQDIFLLRVVVSQQWAPLPAPCSGSCSSWGCCDEAAAPCELAGAVYFIRLGSLSMDGNAICFGRFLGGATEKGISQGADFRCQQTIATANKVL